MKVIIVIGTRPEIIKLSRIITVLDQTVDHILVHTGQNCSPCLNQIFFSDLELRQPDYYLSSSKLGLFSILGDIMYNLDIIITREKPDAMLILGDTNSCLGAAYVAKRRKIPLFHMEAGNRCFDERVPEEINRRMIDHISDINLPYSQLARENLIREGLPADQIIITGSPMLEVLQYYKSKIVASNMRERLSLTPNNYFLVSCHREENIDSPNHFRNFIAVLKYLAETFHQRVIVSTHPRTRKRLDETKLIFDPLIEFSKPFKFTDYVYLQMGAKAILSDSGTITEEASILNLRALNLREAHERPEGMEEGSVMLTGFNINRIKEGLSILDKQKVTDLNIPLSYCIPNVSVKIVRIILSYTDYINRKVWRKDV